jgi:ABC-2 type transport system permease protein
MRAAFIIALKDLSQRIRDKSAILLGLVAPLGLALIFSAIIPDATASSFNVHVGVVDNDGGQITSGFINDVLPAVEAEGLLSATRFDDMGKALAEVENGDLDAVYIFPAGYSASVQSGAGGTVRLVTNVDSTIGGQIAKAVLDSYLAHVETVTISAGTAMINGAQDLAAITAAAQAAAPAVELTDVQASNRTLDTTTFFAAGMAVFFLFFTVQFGVSSLLEERMNGTLPRLLGAPISRWSVLGGKALTSFVLGLVSMVVLAISTTLLIGATWGNPVGVAILMMAGVLSALGIMAVVAVIARTPEQAANWQSIVAVVLGLMGGTFFPLSQGPRLLALLSKLTPHAWFMQGLGDLSSGAGLSTVIAPTLAMLAFFVVTLGISVWFGRGRVLAP